VRCWHWLCSICLLGCARSRSRHQRRWQSSEAEPLEALDGYDSDENSTFSGLDEHPSSYAADDSFREGHLFVPVQVGFARPAPLGAVAMSFEEAAVLSGSSFGGLSLQ
jgi:hypothetical protein